MSDPTAASHRRRMRDVENDSPIGNAASRARLAGRAGSNALLQKMEDAFYRHAKKNKIDFEQARVLLMNARFK